MTYNVCNSFYEQPNDKNDLVILGKIIVQCKRFHGACQISGCL